MTLLVSPSGQELDANAATVRLVVTPDRALIDADIAVQLSGLAPRTLVTLRAYVQTDAETLWQSHATFISDRHGNLDLATATPLDGTYLTADANGLLWSLTLAASSAERIRDSRFIESGLEDFRVEFVAEVDGRAVAEAGITRSPITDGVRCIPVRPTEADVDAPVGTLFLPAGLGTPAPAIVVVPGSNGGIPEAQSALFASHGYAVLALGYFRAGEQLPPTLEEIPLEYFERAFAWLQRQDGVDASRLTVSGTSRGGELALLLGATFDAVRAVIAWVPSGFVNRGFAAIGDDRVRAAWTRDAIPLPFLSAASRRADLVREQNGGVVFALAALHGLQEQDDLSEVEIPVERIQGPVHLISGRDDTLWPSGVYSDWIVERLRDNGFTHRVEHLTYEHAGHTLGPANGPATLLVGPDAGKVSSVRTNLGGTPEGVARARADLWPKVLRFLSEVPAR